MSFSYFRVLYHISEILLGDSSCPWVVKMELVSAGVECTFAYKRMDAKIAWPVNFRRS